MADNLKASFHGNRINAKDIPEPAAQQPDKDVLGESKRFKDAMYGNPQGKHDHARKPWGSTRPSAKNGR